MDASSWCQPANPTMFYAKRMFCWLIDWLVLITRVLLLGFRVAFYFGQKAQNYSYWWKWRIVFAYLMCLYGTNMISPSSIYLKKNKIENVNRVRVVYLLRVSLLLFMQLKYKEQSLHLFGVDIIFPRGLELYENCFVYVRSVDF